MTNLTQISQPVYSFPIMNWNYGVRPPLLMEVMNYVNPMRLEFACRRRPRTGNNSKGTIRPNNMYKRPQASNELQNRNRNRNQKRLKGRKFYYNKKKKLPGFAPRAPRNTSSFLIRAKECGGVSDLASPYPVTPAVLPTPNFSTVGDIVGDMAKVEWGVNVYGSMDGLLRVRSPGYGYDEVERRLDHNVGRFEMIRPANNDNGSDEDRVDFEESSNDSQYEEESLSVKNRLCLMENQIKEFRKRLKSLENK